MLRKAKPAAEACLQRLAHRSHARLPTGPHLEIEPATDGSASKAHDLLAVLALVHHEHDLLEARVDALLEAVADERLSFEEQQLVGEDVARHRVRLGIVTVLAGDHQRSTGVERRELHLHIRRAAARRAADFGKGRGHGARGDQLLAELRLGAADELCEPVEVHGVQELV
eukprot:1207443-Prymnesium_polylepis.1